MQTQPRSPQGRGFKRRDPGQEREQLVDAFTKLAAERGYAQTAVDDIIAEAGLSSHAFHDQFSDKRQCLLAAYDRFLVQLVEEVEEAVDLEAPWPLQVRTGVSAALDFIIERADAARLFAVEALTVGPPGVDRYGAAIQRVSALLRHGRGRSAGAAELPALTEPVLAAGAFYVVTAVLLAEDSARLPRLESQLVEVLLLPYAGGGEARGALA